MTQPLRLVAFSLGLPALIACCAVSRDSSPSILSQRNVIVWDSKTKTEHFIRQAAFKTETTDFGFVVATPSLPKVSEVDRNLLGNVRALDPQIQTQRAVNTANGTASNTAAAAGGIDVLQVEDAGAYTITTLKASDSSALEAWLKTNKYNVPADIQEWVDGYISKKWLFTAFKLKSDRVDQVGNLPCLTFKADEPFAPYRVPKSNRSKTESLEIYFLSDEPYGAFVDNKRQDIDQWCSRIRSEHTGRLTSSFENRTQIPAGWVASYMKADFPTDAADDMVFRPVNKEIFEQPNVATNFNYTLFLASGVVVAGFGWMIVSKKPSQPTSDPNTDSQTR